MRQAQLYDILTGDDVAGTCNDLPESACRHRPENFLVHVISLTATKTGDALADPKLVLAWLLGALGAPSAAVGLLVPIRESLALLPQLFISAPIRAYPVRKWFWAAGSLVQGLCVLAIAGVAFSLRGAAAGWMIVALLAVFACARSVCSASYKDVLAKTVDKQNRGTATGAAGSVAAALTLGLGLSLATGIVPLSVSAIGVILVIAGCLWLLAGVFFLRLTEESGDTDDASRPLGETLRHLASLRRDRQFVHFVAVRAFLTPTALAPPFLLAIAGESADRNLATLGPFVIASGMASILSSYVWGRFADRSSRQVLITAAVGAATVLAASGFFTLFRTGAGTPTYLMAVALFVLMIAYQGVRLGRSTHLVDMADEGQRVYYTALSNSAIGIVLLGGGAFGFLADLTGPQTVLIIFAVSCMAAAGLALGLEEVQRK